MNVVLGVTGSIAAYKAPQLVRLLVDAGHSVSCVMTRSAAKFVSPLVLSTFSQNPVPSDMFGEDAARMPHLTLAEKADVFVVAPMSLTILGRCANGLADDLVSLVYLTTKAPVLMAPAMHDTMWEHAATKDNVQKLLKRGVTFLGPVKGKLADNKKAAGRMVEPEEIVKAIG